MLTFLCRLTPEQWQQVHNHAPDGVLDQEPDGYHAAGLYEWDNGLVVLQAARYWQYAAIFQRPTLPPDRYAELIDLAEEAREQADTLHKLARQMEEEASHHEHAASEFYRQALLG